MKLLFSILISIFLLSNITGQEELELLSRWHVDTIPGSRSYDNAYNEVWGLVVDNHEYAVIGSTLGTHILSLDDPQNPIEIHFIPGASQGPQIVHRDFHDYRGYLYAIAGEGANSTLQIIDISKLPDTVHIVYNSKELIRRTHNIFIDTSAAKLYGLITSGDSLPYSPMRIFSLEDPTNPVVLNSYNDFDGVNISQVHDAYVKNDTAYLNCGPLGLFIVDFEDTDNPQVLSFIESGELELSSYNHSGWLSDDGTAYYVADEVWGKDIKVFDVRDYANIELSATVNADGSRFSIPHNQVVGCQYLYSSYYYDGLQVYDISDPLHPVRKYYYHTSNKTPRRNYEGAWGVYPLLPSGIILASDMQEGLFILQGPKDACDMISANEEINRDNTLRIFPNPSSNDDIFLKTEQRVSKLSLIDVQGMEQEIGFFQNGKLVQIHIQKRPQYNGIYVLKIETPQGVITEKIMLSK